MQIKKDIPLFIVLALVFTWLLLNGRSASPTPCMGSCLKENAAGKCIEPKTIRGGGGSSSPLNFITRGIFHIPS